MEKETIVNEPKRFSKSVGAGMKSVFGGKGRNFYVLEHLNASRKHKQGDRQEIIVDYIEIGRDPQRQVSFGDSFPTVSRRHASIARDGANWTLTQLSQKNPTLVNGKAVANKWYLQNGDEIRFSYEGPALRFLIPNNNVVGSIGFTRRLNLFRKQALRPYKAALSILSTVIILSLAGGAFYIKQKEDEARRWQETLIVMEKVSAENAAQLIEQNKKNEELVSSLKEKVKILEKKQEELKIIPASQPPVASVEPLYPNVFYLSCNEVWLTMPDGTTERPDISWAGTGFLLNDGKLVTARHVVEPWYFAGSGEDVLLAINVLLQMGATLDYKMIAISPDGSAYEFDSKFFYIDPSGDAMGTLSNESVIRMGAWDKDWSYVQTTLTGALSMDKSLSASLKAQTELHILGYPLHYGAKDPNDVSPLYSTTRVARSGLHDGVIYITDRNFDHGNSGGPVMYYDNGIYTVIGIVSAGDGEVGFIVPVSALL